MAGEEGFEPSPKELESSLLTITTLPNIFQDTSFQTSLIPNHIFKSICCLCLFLFSINIITYFFNKVKTYFIGPSVFTISPFPNYWGSRTRTYKL